MYRKRYFSQLEEIACQLRIDSLEMINRRQAGHPGGSLSAAEIMAALFFHKLRLDPARPDWPERDRFILSKGHASAILYAALARRGFFPLADLERWGELDCHLQGHPDRLKTPGVEMTLGHPRARHARSAPGWRSPRGWTARRYRVYVLLGDGECQAGVVWEGAMAAAKFRLANLTAILDYNDVQLDGPVHEIMPLEPLAAKWRAFNWNVIEINGHNMRQVLEALDFARRDPRAAHGHHRPHHQGQGRVVHGESTRSGTAWRPARPNCEQALGRAARAGRSGEELMGEGNVAMREAYGRALAEYGATNPQLVVLDPDTSSSTLSNYFAQRFPQRFFNIGIAEPCMVDMAVGLALGGQGALRQRLRRPARLPGAGADPHLRLLRPHQRQADRRLRRRVRLQGRADAPRHHRHRHDAGLARDDGDRAG